MLKKLTRVLLACLVFLIPGFFAYAGNIVPSDSSANLEIDNTDVYFVCDGCDVEVTDTEVNGLIWGESLGWVNLQPSDGGVFNTRLGVVSGNAWGSISGWINFTGVFIDPENGEFSGQAFSQNRGPIVFDCPGPDCVITTWRPYGCTNPDANNYDPTATVDDGSCQVVYDPAVPGCTDPSANNYNSNADTNDGSCTYDEVPQDPVDPGDGGGTNIPGCTDSTANNYNQFANVNDGSCLYGGDISGCMDPESPLYDPEATISDLDACVLDSYGCTDPEAINYNPLVTFSNNSCIYDNPNGCLDILALNYNPLATIEDGSCVYDEPENGCTDPEALNYNPFAIFNNGTCLYEEDFETPVGDPENPNDTEDGVTGPGPGDNLMEDTNNDSIPDILQGGQEMIENFFDGVPGTVGELGKILNQYFADKSKLGKILTLALLIGSIIQTLPFREGNLLFSFFSFYKTRKYWGTVYDSITKQPIDPAYVTLFDEAGQAIDTSITDIDGRYSFTVGPGKYFLSAQKTDYQFPSERLAGKKYDELYSHLYFGGEVVVETQDGIISRNIPMDPLRFNWNEYAKQKTRVTNFYKPWHRTLHFCAKVLFFVGFIFAIWVFTVSPSIFSFIILSLYIITALFKILGLFRPTPRGYVKDRDGFAVSFAIIRVYSETLHREVKHTVVGPKGHYLLLVPNGHYHMTIEQKLQDGSYQQIHKTKPFKVRKGYIAQKITLHEKLIETSGQKFDSMFNQTQKKIS